MVHLSVAQIQKKRENNYFQRKQYLIVFFSKSKINNLVFSSSRKRTQVKSKSGSQAMTTIKSIVKRLYLWAGMDFFKNS